MQASIAPCVLISGIGLILLSVTNRLARPIDRIRSLSSELKGATGEEALALKEQILILYRRCQFLRISVASAIASIFFVALIILLLFSIYLFDIHLEILIKSFFAASLICLIISLVYFLLDIRLALHSVKIEINKLANTA